MSRASWKRVLPALVSVGILVWILRGVDPSALVGALTWRVAALMLPALLAYGAVTLWIETLSLTRPLESVSSTISRWTAARIKCASYLLGVVNYALGVAALSVLLQLRAGLPLGRAASVVLLISSVDLLVVLGLAGLATAWMQSGAPAVNAGVLFVALAGFFGGLALLRTPASLGPLDRLRSLSIFEGMRNVPAPRLAELFALRILFAVCFVSICAAAFAAFEVSAPFVVMVAGVLIVAVVAAIPIAVAGLGTSQAAFLYLFADYGSQETLLAMSLILSAGMLGLRALMGTVFAREFTREALRETRGATA
jgi:uncharacterized membrane protein YbhN (UPF0104 family)